MQAVRHAIEAGKSIASPPGSSSRPRCGNPWGHKVSLSTAKFPVVPPNKYTGDDAKVDVKQALKSVKRFLSLKQVPIKNLACCATTFLQGSALRVWDTKLDGLEAMGVSATWEHFEGCLTSFFGSQIARDTSIKYEKCVPLTSVALFSCGWSLGAPGVSPGALRRGRDHALYRWPQARS